MVDDLAWLRQVRAGRTAHDFRAYRTLPCSSYRIVRAERRPRGGAPGGKARPTFDYTYCGFEPSTNLGLLVFGVDNLNKASEALDELAAEKAQ